MASPGSIPVIDLGPYMLGEPGGFDLAVKAFFNAYSTTGFAVVVNHDIPPLLTSRVFAASRQFHALPLPLKNAVQLDRNHRGYIPINTSTDVNTKLADVKKPNQSESFIMLREDTAESPEVVSGAYLAGPNQWPELPGFRSAVTACHDALSRLGYQLMEIACSAIGAEKSRVMPAFDRPTTWFRLLRYPPAPVDLEEGVYGSAPHTDFGCLTILLQDNTGGLQVMAPDGQWIDVQPQPGAFVVNVGDMLHRWSNGVLKSTPHRVINRSGRERYSCPFFFDPNVATVIAPLAGCVTTDHPAQFPAIEFGEFLRAELEAGYNQHKSSGYHREGKS